MLLIDIITDRRRSPVSCYTGINPLSTLKTVARPMFSCVGQKHKSKLPKSGERLCTSFEICLTKVVMHKHWQYVFLHTGYSGDQDLDQMVAPLKCITVLRCGSSLTYKIT